MKKLYFLLIVLYNMAVFYQIKAQDIIVNKTGDTLFCKITNIDSNKIMFVINKNEKVISTFLYSENIAEYKYNYNVKPIIQETDTFTDSRDGKVYQTVAIGTQTWLAENLDASTFRNGDTILEAKTGAEWRECFKHRKPAWCYHSNDTANGRKYGKLYNWYAVNDPRGLAPKGWHVSSDIEWTTLVNYLGVDKDAGTKMKSTSGWENDGNGTNTSGFTALPGNFRSDIGLFGNIGYAGCWWSSTESYTNVAWWWELLSSSGKHVYRDVNREEYGLSVRCVKD